LVRNCVSVCVSSSRGCCVSHLPSSSIAAGDAASGWLACRTGCCA
jgi:hypothetical protein